MIFFEVVLLSLQKFANFFIQFLIVHLKMEASKVFDMDVHLSLQKYLASAQLNKTSIIAHSASCEHVSLPGPMPSRRYVDAAFPSHIVTMVAKVTVGSDSE